MIRILDETLSANFLAEPLFKVIYSLYAHKIFVVLAYLLHVVESLNYIQF